MSCWYTQNAPENDIVISTRVRLARNLSGVPFPSRMTIEQRREVNDSVKRAIIESNTPFAKSLKFIAMKDVPEIERYSMVERHIISREFASNCRLHKDYIDADQYNSVLKAQIVASLNR